MWKICFLFKLTLLVLFFLVFFQGNNSFSLFTAPFPQRLCGDIQLHCTLLTLSGEPTSVADKILTLYLKQPPIILMVLIPQHQATPHLEEMIRANVTVILFNPLQFHLFRRPRHFDLGAYVMGQTLVTAWEIVFSQC